MCLFIRCNASFIELWLLQRHCIKCGRLFCISDHVQSSMNDSFLFKKTLSPEYVCAHQIIFLPLFFLPPPLFSSFSLFQILNSFLYIYTCINAEHAFVVIDRIEIKLSSLRPTHTHAYSLGISAHSICFYFILEKKLTHI